jgi:nucleoside-diphosphate-sugar epimerase
MHQVFVTGATGFLGHYVLRALLRRRGVCCRVLLRPPVSVSRARLGRLLEEIGLDLNALTESGRVIPVEGELPERFDAAGLGGADLIVHAAGVTSFEADASGEPFRTNVQGTEALLAAAERRRVGRFLLLSTAYVCGLKKGLIPEAVVPVRPPLCNDYEESKWRAEQLVWAWGRNGKVATVCRPSVVMGDRLTGRATNASGMYLVARATELLAKAVAEDPQADPLRTPLRILGRADARSDIVPVCWVADRIAAIALQPELQGRVYHLTNPNPPTHGQLKKWLEDYFHIGGGRFVDPDRPLADLNRFEEVFYSLGSVVGDYFRRDHEFESNGLAGTPRNGALVDGRLFFKWLSYARSTNWMRSREAPVRIGPPNGDVDPQWYFEHYLPWAVPRSRVARVKALTTTARFVLSGARERRWVCRFESGRLVESLRGGDDRGVDFSYRVTQAAFGDIVTGRQTMQDVFFKGKADIIGDTFEALKMVSIMSEFIREFPVTGAAPGGKP